MNGYTNNNTILILNNLSDKYHLCYYKINQIDMLINHQVLGTGSNYILPLVKDYNMKFMPLCEKTIKNF